MHTDSWLKCYGDGWGKRLRPASFAHPAKASYALTVRIYEHALAEGWIEAGQYLIDPFSGVGGFALEAMRHGLNFVGVELEQRFVDMGQGYDCTGIGKEDWVRFQGRWGKARYQGGRHWCPECIMKASAVADEREFKALPLPGTKWAALAKTRQATLFDAAPSASYVRNSGQIPCTPAHHYRGNIETWEAQGMPGTAIIVQGDSRRLGEVLERASLCLSSPPYADSIHGSGASAARKRIAEGRYKGLRPDVWTSPGNIAGSTYGDGYSADPANLGNAPDTGFEAALAVASPAFPDGGMGDKRFGGGLKDKSIIKASKVGGGGSTYYGDQPGQLAQMPEGSFDLALSSPVYSQALSGKTNQTERDREHREAIGCNPDSPGSGYPRHYGESSGQLAQMPEGDLALAISSPGYCGSEMSDNRRKDNAFLRGEGRSDNRNPSRGDLTSRYRVYSKTDGQLAALPEGSHAAACLPDLPAIAQAGHRQALDPPARARAGAGAETPACADRGRAQACISSPPWMGQTPGGGKGGFETRPDGTPFGAGQAMSGDYDEKIPYEKRGFLMGKEEYQEWAQHCNLGSITSSEPTFWAASRQILEQVYKVLAPGAHAIWVVKAFVRNKAIVDFPSQWRELCESVGFRTLHEHHALLTEDRGAQHMLDGGLDVRQIKRASFFRRLHESKYPHLAINHEVVLCMVKPLGDKRI